MPATVAWVILGVGVAVFALGLYVRVLRREPAARVVYDVSQVFEGAPADPGLRGAPRAPVAIHVENVGQETARRIVVRLRSRSRIEEFHPGDAALEGRVGEYEAVVVVGDLAPGAWKRMFFYCRGRPTEDQVEALDVRYDDGRGERTRMAPGQGVR